MTSENTSQEYSDIDILAALSSDSFAEFHEDHSHEIWDIIIPSQEQCRRLQVVLGGQGVDYTNLLKIDKRLIRVAIERETGKVVGGFYIEQPSLDAAGVVHDAIKGLAVHQDHARNYKRRGIGRLLVQTWENMYRDLGVRKIEFPTRIGGRPFYEKLGYSIREERKEWTITYFASKELESGQSTIETIKSHAYTRPSI